MNKFLIRLIASIGLFGWLMLGRWMHRSQHKVYVGGAFTDVRILDKLSKWKGDSWHDLRDYIPCAKLSEINMGIPWVREFIKWSDAK